jgi:hypothetical protein
MPIGILLNLALGLISLAFLSSMQDFFKLRQDMISDPRRAIHSYCASQPGPSLFVINLQIFIQDQRVKACETGTETGRYRRWQIEWSLRIRNSDEFRLMKMQYLR